MGIISEAVFVFQAYPHYFMCRTKSAFLKTRAGAERRFAITNCYASGPHDAVERYRPFHAQEVNGEARFAGYEVATTDTRLAERGRANCTPCRPSQ